MNKKKILVSVISDLVSDQRVHKVCTFLHEHGFDVLLIGRMHGKSASLEKRAYATERIQCFFSKGPLFYAEFNLKLFVRLCTRSYDVLLSNDLDTLLPNFIHARVRKKKLVYDSHEYFIGMPELQTKPLKRKIWQTLERLLLPRIENSYTVNQSIADLYAKQYKINMHVVRNVPYNKKIACAPSARLFPENKTILLMQGAGINLGRGAEELVQSMQYLPDHFLLIIVGGGDVWKQLHALKKQLHLEAKVTLIEKVPFMQLQQYTKAAHLGLSLDKPFCLNYELSLPNKLFDYIHAGVPVLATNIKEVSRIIDTYQVGMTIDEATPQNIANAIKRIFADKEQYSRWKENTYKAAATLCWENEAEVLKKIYCIG